MFADLPKLLQEKVREYLQDNNFPAAKALYDEYHTQHPKQSHNSRIKSSSTSKINLRVHDHGKNG